MRLQDIAKPKPSPEFIRLMDYFGLPHDTPPHARKSTVALVKREVGADRAHNVEIAKRRQ